MAKKPYKYLKFYHECMSDGCAMSQPGLCCCVEISDSMIDLFTPTIEDEIELRSEGASVVWWGSGVDEEERCRLDYLYSFTPLRQTIVLFMAAMNNEL